MEKQADETAVQRRVFRWRLRTMFLVVALIGCVFAVVASWYRYNEHSYVRLVQSGGYSQLSNGPPEMRGIDKTFRLIDPGTFGVVVRHESRGTDVAKAEPVTIPSRPAVEGNVVALQIVLDGQHLRVFDAAGEGKRLLLETTRCQVNSSRLRAGNEVVEVSPEMTRLPVDSDVPLVSVSSSFDLAEEDGIGFHENSIFIRVIRRAEN